MVRPSSAVSSSSELSGVLRVEYTVKVAEARLKHFKEIHPDDDSIQAYRLLSALLKHAPERGKLYIANEVCRPALDPTWDLRTTLLRRSSYFKYNLMDAFQGKTKIKSSGYADSLYDSGSTSLSDRYTPEGAKRNQKTLKGELLKRDGGKDILSGYYHRSAEMKRRLWDPSIKMLGLKVAHILTFHYNELGDKRSDASLLLEKDNNEKSLEDNNINKDNTKQTKKRRRASQSSSETEDSNYMEEDIDDIDDNVRIPPISSEALATPGPTSSRKAYYWHALSLFLGSRRAMMIVKGVKINDPANALLLEPNLHEAFDALLFSLQPIPDETTENHKYKVCFLERKYEMDWCQDGKEVDLTPVDSSIPAPSRYLIWVHHLLFQVYHDSGLAEYFDTIEESFHEHGVLENGNISKLLTILDYLSKSEEFLYPI